MTKALRFLRVVDATPVWMTVVSLAVALYGLALTWIDRTGVDDALGMLLLWQMLAASRGFARAASARHFDPILVRTPRTSIAAAHGLRAVAGVIAVWMAVGAVEALRGTMRPLAFEPGRLCALAFVSAGAWAMSLPAPRFLAGSLWLMIVVALAATRFGLERYAAMMSAPEGPAQVAQAVLFAWVCPFLLLESNQPARAILALALGAGAAASAACGVWYVSRRNYPLEPSL